MSGGKTLGNEGRKRFTRYMILKNFARRQVTVKIFSFEGPSKMLKIFEDIEPVFNLTQNFFSRITIRLRGDRKPGFHGICEGALPENGANP